MPGAHPTNEDLNGFKRGEHVEGPHICEQYVFQAPGQTSGVWGWNDTQALYCAACGRLASDHVVLAKPTFEEIKKKPPPSLPSGYVLDSSQLLSTRAYQAERAASAKTALDMLDETVDPLAVAAQIRPSQRSRAAAAAPGCAPGCGPTPAASVEEEALASALAGSLGVSRAKQGSFPAGGGAKPDEGVAALLARETAYNDSFKDEVERMVRESIAAERRKELELELDARMPPQQQSGAPPAAAPRRHASVASLLEAAALPQYLATFEEEAMDAETLYGVMESQGRTALEEVLLELGVRSKGHRMKIANLVAP